MTRMILKKLVFRSPGNTEKKPAVIDFTPGFNVITGPSDTGKTLIFECINYVLGSSKRPKEPPEAKGYTNLFLTIATENSEFTLERNILSNDIRIYKAAYDNITNCTENEILSVSPKAQLNISNYLLDIVGMLNKRLKKNERNETISLTFNVLRNLLLVNEIKIQENTSPIFTGELMSNTSEKALFRFMLTGIDYSNIIVQQKPGIRKADANARINLLQKLINDSSLNLNKNTTKEELHEQLNKISVSIEDGTNKVFENQKEIESLRVKRKEVFETAVAADSKIDQLKEILSRFNLLAKHYQTDLDRLDAIIETGSGLSHSADEHCPLCGSEPAYHQPECVISDKNINEIKISCEHEKRKINSLKADLSKTISQVSFELKESSTLKENNEAEYKQIDKLVREKLEPSINELKNNMRQLFEIKNDLELTMGTMKQISVMEDLKVIAEKDLKAPPKATPVPTGVQAAEAGDLMKVIEKTLTAWSYPSLGRVAFSEVNQDIIIGDKNRSEQGKGYRAITHAAFIISLMEHCIDKNMPHPGFVVLDSPLVTYRGADKRIQPDEAVSEDMKEKFYNALSGLQKDKQVIVLENDAPPANATSKMNYIHFTKDPALGRAGFIPQPGKDS